MPPITQNTLFYGDNLPILRDYIDDESVDLIYLDPPFNSNRSYNVLFKDESGQEVEAQITAFEDTWHWNAHTEEVYYYLVTLGDPQVSSMIGALRDSIGSNQMMAYLVMMAARLSELRRVLKSTGSLYLHCDPTASHYLKLLMDAIFGPPNFRNEIVWHYGQRTAFHKGHFSRKHDIILFYARSPHHRINSISALWDREKFIKHRHDLLVDEKGREYIWTDGGPGKPRYKRYVNKVLEQGKPIDTVWDIPLLNSASRERLGYPTQKPVALLERIISASSNLGDVVLDPFCGCGTTIAAAQKLGRRWIGIDITHLSIALQKYRLKDSFGLVEKKDYTVIGEPEDFSSAQQLAEDNRYQFQWWALSLIKARPLGGASGSKRGKKGSDKGIDGVITFIDEAGGKPKRNLVQVKSGKVKSGDIRDLRGAVEREEAAMGIFITLEHPSHPMETEAASAGIYHSPGWNEDYPKLQIVTIADLLDGVEIKMPPTSKTFKEAAKAKGKEEGEQAGLF